LDDPNKHVPVDIEEQIIEIGQAPKANTSLQSVDLRYNWVGWPTDEHFDIGPRTWHCAWENTENKLNGLNTQNKHKQSELFSKVPN